MKRLVVDLDDTFSFNTTGNYRQAAVNHDLVVKLKQYQTMGFCIVINTSREPLKNSRQMIK
jgi:hypothetical protein